MSRASPFKTARIEDRAAAQAWPGYVPHSRITPDKLSALGFSVRLTSDAAVEQAVLEIAREVFA